MGNRINLKKTDRPIATNIYLTHKNYIGILPMVYWLIMAIQRKISDFFLEADKEADTEEAGN